MYTNNVSFSGKFSLLRPKHTQKYRITQYTAHNGIQPIYQPPKPTKIQQIIKNIKFFLKANNPFRES